MTPSLFPKPKTRAVQDEFISGETSRVARKPIVWDEALDLRVIEAADDAALAGIAEEIGVSVSRLKRRQDALFSQVFKEMTEERL